MFQTLATDLDAIGADLDHRCRVGRRSAGLFPVLMLIGLVLPASAARSFVWSDTDADGVDDTFAETHLNEVTWLQWCAAYALGQRTFVCTQARIDAAECPSEALGTEFPRLRQQLCVATNSQCDQAAVDAGDSWTVNLIRCGDGTFGGDPNANCAGAGDPDPCCTGAGTGTCLDYDRWPGNKLDNSPEYDSLCRAKWKNNGWWVPRWSHCKLILRQREKDAYNAGTAGGEAKILEQSRQRPETAPE